ncbi:MAG TPA: pyruvate dehydrogenase (acetyl-transferring), homodimeric type [Sandaracinaceae bacterium LLY-WYZ-13_1]|nr:pyruvate dehydrogenase (acetyl-transferring), homodimeric type [Sandaracinaceae bacterium LLY-WYZ-13_1]
MSGSTAARREALRERTRDWLEALDGVLDAEGPEATAALLRQLARRAAARGATLEPRPDTPYVNTLPYPAASDVPGDEALEARIEALVRWNTMAIVARANRERPGAGGHIASHASIATALEIALNHFVRGRDHEAGPDRLYVQGHASPGIYARAFLEGRLSEAQLGAFRQELGADGLSSYPHPWLMPDFWETPSVSMGLAPIMAIYQARFDRYLHDRGRAEHVPRTWAFLGDGEMDEPESVGALTFAARQGLSQLTFVVDCNLQRLDGPVRGSGQVIRELGALFRGAGWRVIQVLWNGPICELLAHDEDGRVARVLDETLDGTWQRLAAEGEAALRAHLIGGDPRLQAVAGKLGPFDRGGHDRRALFAAFDAAAQESERPTVILAQTVKGHLLGEAGEARNVAHKTKKLEGDALRAFRDRLGVPVADDDLEALPFLEAPDDVARYLEERREALGGPRPARRVAPPPLESIPEAPFERFLGGSDREVTTTAWLVRMLSQLLKDEALGERVVPIVPDEARTFGVEALFPQVGIYEPEGQPYEPVDADMLLTYRETAEGVILEEGISEAGAMGSFIAAGTSHANGGPAMVPFFFFYSMFGFQRVGDLIWAAGDSRARGFLIGATSGRTTLNGEGLQHQDGHSHLLAHGHPTVRAYDVTYGWEVTSIVNDGLRRMLVEGEDTIVYLTVANEPYEMPAMPEGARDGAVRGLYAVAPAEDAQVSLLGTGVLLREALRAQAILDADFDVRADVYAMTSWQQLYRDAASKERWARLHPTEEPPPPVLREVLGERRRPLVAVSDWVKALPHSLARWLPGPVHALGTDGFGRSDTREALRDHFEVDARHVVVAALSELSRSGAVSPRTVGEAIDALGVDPERDDPRTR